MRPETARRLVKADRFLTQAAKQSAEDSEATIHLAYYAMLHAAAAVLIERIGQAPESHGSIVGQFSQQVSADEQGRMFGRALNRASSRRFVSDYDDGTAPSAAAADRLRSIAHEFVAYCRSLL